MKKITLLIIGLLILSCAKDEPVEQEALESTALKTSKINSIWNYEGNDTALVAFLKESFYSLPEYSNSWKGQRYALVIVQGGEQPYVNGEAMYRGDGNFWYIYSLQGGRQDRGDELVSDNLGLYELKDLEKGEVLVIKNQ